MSDSRKLPEVESKMHFGISTFLLTLYASIHIAQADFINNCDCETNGIIDIPSTEDCCQASLGGFFGNISCMGYYRSVFAE
ncbi:hypothetical protein C8R46DRAFT_1287306 [Mycena filopes]|nr:hypothetical protein C8R46DRAFT_1287306 [Mycena filopes]